MHKVCLVEIHHTILQWSTVENINNQLGRKLESQKKAQKACNNIEVEGISCHDRPLKRKPHGELGHCVCYIFCKPWQKTHAIASWLLPLHSSKEGFLQGIYCISLDHLRSTYQCESVEPAICMHRLTGTPQKKQQAEIEWQPYSKHQTS